MMDSNVRNMIKTLKEKRRGRDIKEEILVTQLTLHQETLHFYLLLVLTLHRLTYTPALCETSGLVFSLKLNRLPRN